MRARRLVGKSQTTCACILAQDTTLCMQEVLYLVLELSMPYHAQAIFPMTNPVIEMLCQKFEHSLVPDEITML